MVLLFFCLFRCASKQSALLSQEAGASPKVAAFSTTKSLAFPVCICDQGGGPEVPGAVESQREVFLLFQQTAAVHHCSALICTQNKLRILGVKPWH